MEDALGAGALAAALIAAGRSASPEAAVAAAGVPLAGMLTEVLLACGSGRELVDLGLSLDVEVAAALDVSRTTPHLVDGTYVDASRTR